MRATIAFLLAALAASTLTASTFAAPALETPRRDDFWDAGRAALNQRMTIANRPDHAKNAKGGEGGPLVSKEGWALDDRGVPMTTLSYINGPFISPGLSRLLPPTDRNYLANKLHGGNSESHGGEDVALFADGPRANLVGGVLEQNVIFHIIAEALGWR